MEEIYYTPQGLANLKRQIHELKTKGRSEVARQIAEAKEKGGVYENAEYEAAKEVQALMEMRIVKLEEEVANARFKGLLDGIISQITGRI